MPSPSTPPIELQPFAPAFVLALIESTDQFRAVSGWTAAEGLREFYVSDDISPAWLEMLRNSSETDPWQHGFAVVEQQSGSVIGTAGFKGPPDENGVVEIAYGVVPSKQGRGVATAAAGLLVEYAITQGDAKQIIAHTLPEHNASTRVLKKNGFEFAGEVIDPEDGKVWRWERGVE